jgi:recombinational DNA repair ATPase RecF
MEDNKPDFKEAAENDKRFDLIKSYYNAPAHRMLWLDAYETGANHGYTLASERYKKELEERDKEIERLKVEVHELDKHADELAAQKDKYYNLWYELENKVNL